MRVSVTQLFRCAVVCAGSLPAVAAPEAAVDFGREVRPILSNACFKCHGPDEATRQSGLRLDTFEGATALLRSGTQAVVPGDPGASALLARVASHDASDVMPPPEAGKPLDAAAVETLRRWIAEGAEYRPHWAFVPPRRPDLPVVSNPAWPRNGIDHFILATLDREGLAPAVEADRNTLIRRVHLDLTGLPPTPEEVAAFVADPSPVAYELLVERLLDSPRYGERWARVWLDLARYADTKGYEKDDRRTMWRYRDWVIDAFNRDLPFDQFTTEQLAGDLLPDAGREQLLATAFHRNTMTNDEGGTDDEEFRSAAVIDRANTTMSVWMGMTMGCAQCHTHKYDPITHREYFQFYAFFNQTEDADTYPVESPVEPFPTAEQARALRVLDDAIARADARLASSVEQALRANPDWEQELRAEVESYPAYGPWRVAPFFEAADYDTAFDRAYPPELSPDGHPAWEERPDFTDGAVHSLTEGRVGATYLRRAIHAPRGRHVEFLFGSNDGLRVWLNGREIHTHRDGRAAALDQDRVKARLRKGENLLLVKVVNAGAGHAFAFRADDQRLPEAVSAALAAAPEARTPEQQAILHARFAEVSGDLAPLRDAAQALRAEKEALEKQVPLIPVLRELPADQRRETRVFEGGSFLNPGEPVAPGVPAIFPPLPADAPPDRLGLARWLVSRENPLTARVTVNRHWGELFGRAIVGTVEDFGTQGDWPTHPELLDWLAVEFMDQAWSLKALCRLIVTSSTYRQSSAISPDLLERDPYNAWYARGPRHRLDAETIRDQALAVAGLLSDKSHGPSVMPPQPEGVWRLVYNADRWEVSAGEDRHRRGLYTFWRRSSPYPSMVTFDAPLRDVCAAQRPRTNTPLQAFVTLNDPVYVEAAQALGRRMLREGGDSPVTRARYGFAAAVARDPSPEELVALTGLYQSELEHYRADSAAAAEMATVPLGPLPEGTDPAEAAAWTVVGNVLLNLDELLNKT
jgi:hypothetical protein